MKPWLRYIPRLALVLVALGLTTSTPNYFSAGSMATILGLGSIVGVLALGQAFVLIGGGFDLSQGATMAASAAIAAILVVSKGMSPWLAAPIAIGAGALLGSINGAFVSVVGTNPFVTTLSTMLLFRGVAFWLLGGLPIDRVTAFRLLEVGPEIGRVLVPSRAFLFLTLTALGWLILSRTVFGRHIYAVGGNLRAARLSGLPTHRLRIATFAISGASAALAALMQISWVHVAKPDTGFGIELESIAACVVGGISLQGGSGNIAGAAVGCLLLNALGLYISMSLFPSEYRNLATGAVLLTFAASDALARRV